MPLMIQFRQGRACPTVVCDCCQPPITRAAEGGYFYDPTNRSADELTEMLFLHKGACDRAYSSCFGRLDHWGELKALPFFLVNNLDITWTQARDTGSLLSSIG